MKHSAARKPAGDTTFIPVVTMEEVPVLADNGRAELVASLKEAQADIAGGRFTGLAAGEVGPWLANIAREERRFAQLHSA